MKNSSSTAWKPFSFRHGSKLAEGNVPGKMIHTAGTGYHRLFRSEPVMFPYPFGEENL